MECPEPTTHRSQGPLPSGAASGSVPGPAKGWPEKPCPPTGPAGPRAPTPPPGLGHLRSPPHSLWFRRAPQPSTLPSPQRPVHPPPPYTLLSPRNLPLPKPRAAALPEAPSSCPLASASLRDPSCQYPASPRLQAPPEQLLSTCIDTCSRLLRNKAWPCRLALRSCPSPLPCPAS